MFHSSPIWFDFGCFWQFHTFNVVTCNRFWLKWLNFDKLDSLIVPNTDQIFWICSDVVDFGWISSFWLHFVTCYFLSHSVIFDRGSLRWFSNFFSPLYFSPFFFSFFLRFWLDWTIFARIWLMFGLACFRLLILRSILGGSELSSMFLFFPQLSS